MAMPNAPWLAAISRTLGSGSGQMRLEVLRHRLGGRKHHRRHAAREFHPHRIVRFESVLSRYALTDGFGEVLKVLELVGVQKKTHGLTHVGGRAAVEEGGGVWSQMIRAIIFAEEAQHRKMIAKDTRAALGHCTAFGNFRYGPTGFSHVGKEIKFDRGLDSKSMLITTKCLEEQCGSGLGALAGP